MRREGLVAALLVVTLAACRSEKPSPWIEAAEAVASAGPSHGKDLSHAIPIFNVRKLRASQSYFRDALGFKVPWEDGDPPDFCAVTRGDATIFLCEGCQSTPGAWAMLFAPDVDRLYRDFREKGAVVKMPPTDMPWKLREMQVADRDGNIMRFASSTKH